MVCNGSGLSLNTSDLGLVCVLIWDWLRITHFFSTFGDEGGVISSSDDELDDDSLSSDF